MSFSLNFLKLYILEETIIQCCFIQFSCHCDFILERTAAFFAWGFLCQIYIHKFSAGIQGLSHCDTDVTLFFPSSHLHFLAKSHIVQLARKTGLNTVCWTTINLFCICAIFVLCFSRNKKHTHTYQRYIYPRE